MVASEPTFVIVDVCVHKLLITLSEVDDSLDQTDNSKESAGHQTDNQLNDALLGVSQDEFVGSCPSEKDTKESSNEFFFGADRRRGYGVERPTTMQPNSLIKT